MQLAVTILGNRNNKIVPEVLQAVSECNCLIIEMSSAHLGQAIALYLLIEGNWNHIAKFEGSLEILRNNLELQVQSVRSNKIEKNPLGLPYSLEIIASDQDHIIQHVVTFLRNHNISIQELTASRYQAAYSQSLISSGKLVVIIPKEAPLLSIREAFLDFCDRLNIDAIFEPIKR